MDINQIDPTLRKATASFPKLPVTSGFGRALTRSLLPLLLPKPKLPAGITIEKVKTNDGLGLRIYIPRRAKNSCRHVIHPRWWDDDRIPRDGRCPTCYNCC